MFAQEAKVTKSRKMSKERDAEPILTEGEKQKLVEVLRERALKENLSNKQKAYMSDPCLEIHLRARKWDLDKAYFILKESLDWVKGHESLLTNLICPGCVEHPEQHYFKDLGLDVHGRPIIYTTAGCHFNITLKHSYEHNIIAFENAIKAMKPRVERFIYVADLYNLGIGNLDLKSNIQFFKTIQAPYRGRVGQIILIDPPQAISLGIKVIKPFVKPETMEKVIFVKSNEMKQALVPVLGEEATLKLIQEVEENHDKERALKKKWW